MNTALAQTTAQSLLDDVPTYKRLQLNFKRNKQQDQTQRMEQAAATFDLEACRHSPWNPENFSLMWGTPLWHEASAAQRVLLNQLYWVAYYAQIISAEIATIYYNQTRAAGLYALEDFRLVCDTLDLESAQERAHIHAFKTVSESFEASLFGERLFTYPMRGPFAETMVFADSTPFKQRWKALQLRAFGLLSSSHAFLACHYFGIRGLRTLNGKLIQHQLSSYYSKHPQQDSAPVPAAISYYHFQDESYHFNSSMVISHDVIRSLPPPTAFERHVANQTVRGCQRDHRHFSVAINGIFWHDPALFGRIYKLCRSPHFGMGHADALDMLQRCFGAESDGMQASYESHRMARDSYEQYADTMDYLTPDNRRMSLMKQTSIEGTLRRNRDALAAFEAPTLRAAA